MEPFSEDFFDTSKKENYYSRGVSPYIKNVFDDLKIKWRIVKPLWCRLYVGGYGTCI